MVSDLHGSVIGPTVDGTNSSRSPARSSIRRLRRQRDRLDAFDPSLPKTAARQLVQAAVVGEAVDWYSPSRAGRRSPDDDPATTACAGCMRQAVGNPSAGGLVGFDVDFAYWSRWYLLVASRLMGSLNGGARSASTAVSMPALWSQPARQKLVPDRSVTLPSWRRTANAFGR